MVASTCKCGWQINKDSNNGYHSKDGCFLSSSDSHSSFKCDPLSNEYDPDIELHNYNSIILIWDQHMRY